MGEMKFPKDGCQVECSPLLGVWIDIRGTFLPNLFEIQLALDMMCFGPISRPAIERVIDVSGLKK
jgi:hypothetical protein